MPEPAADRVTRIHVTAERPYDVVVGRGVLAQVADVLGSPRRVAVLHPAALIDVAVRVSSSLERAGHEVVRIDVPDAEAAKTVEVAARCWSVLGNAGFTRSDAVVAQRRHHREREDRLCDPVARIVEHRRTGLGEFFVAGPVADPP